LKLGRNSGGNYFNGLIDEVKVSNAAVYSSNFTPQTHLTAAASTMGLWKFDGQTVNDSSTNSNNGTLQGATYSSDVPSGDGGGGSSGGTPSQIQWLVSDHLGTPRIIFDHTGALDKVKRHDYAPFGEELFGGTNASPGIGGRKPSLGYGCEPSNPSCAPDGVRQQFTEKERDNETGLDYFEARYNSSIQGRFTSADPLLASGNPLIPQSWNRYTYCINSPLILVDPTGMMWVYHYLDKEKTRVGIAWIEGNKISKDLSAKGYKALAFGGAKSRDITLTDGSIVRLSANLGRPDVLRPQQSGGDRAYVNTSLVRELGRQTAPIPAATGLFIVASVGGGYEIGAAAGLSLANAAVYGFVTASLIGRANDEQELLAAATTIEEAASKGQKFGPNQQALVELAKEAKRGGVTPEQARTLIDWAREYGVKPARGPEVHEGRPFGSRPHIHVGPVNHIPVKPR